jgi:hypothetical protein
VKELLLDPSLSGWTDPKKYCRRNSKPLKRKIKNKKIISSTPSFWSLWETTVFFFLNKEEAKLA